MFPGPDWAETSRKSEMDVGVEGSGLFSLTPSMTSQLALSAIMIVIAVLIHGVGLFSLSNL